MQSEPDVFTQKFELIADFDPFDLVAALVIESTRNEALQDALVSKHQKPIPDSPYMDFNEACAYLRLTQRQLRDLCRDQNITHARIDYRTYRFKKSDLDEWFEAYKMRRKSVYD